MQLRCYTSEAAKPVGSLAVITLHTWWKEGRAGTRVLKQVLAEQLGVSAPKRRRKAIGEMISINFKLPKRTTEVWFG